MVYLKRVKRLNIYQIIEYFVLYPTIIRVKDALLPYPLNKPSLKGGTPKTVGMNQTLTNLMKEAIKESNYFHSTESDFVFTNLNT